MGEDKMNGIMTGWIILILTEGDIYLLVMPKYWVKKLFRTWEIPRSGSKAKNGEEREKERKKERKTEQW